MHLFEGRAFAQERSRRFAVQCAFIDAVLEEPASLYAIGVDFSFGRPLQPRTYTLFVCETEIVSGFLVAFRVPISRVGWVGRTATNASCSAIAHGS